MIRRRSIRTSLYAFSLSTLSLGAIGCSGNSSSPLFAETIDAATANDSGAAIDGTMTSGTDSGPPPIDGATPEDAHPSVDAKTDEDVALDATSDTTTPEDTGTGPVDASDAGNGGGPARIVSGYVTLVGMTSDDNAIYIDSNGQLLAVATSGSASPVQLSSDASSAQFLVRGKVVFLWENCDLDNFCDVSFYETGHAKTSLGTGSDPGVAEASSDGTRIVYTTDVDETMQTMTIKGTIVGGATTTIVDGTLTDTNCGPTFRFTPNHFVTEYCTPSAIDESATLVSTDASFANTVSIATGVGSRFTVNPSETMIASVGLFGDGLVLFPLAGGAGATVTTDSVDTGPPNSYPDLLDSYIFPFFTADGALLYTGDGGLWRTVLVNPSPLNVSAIPIWQGASANGAFALGSTTITFDGNSVDLFDLFLVPTAAPNATPITIADTVASGDQLATTFSALDRNISQFTSDNNYVLYVDSVDLTTSTGSLHLAPTAGGSLITLSTNFVWRASAAANGHVLFSDDWVTSDVSDGTVSLHVWTGAANGSATLLNTGIDDAYAISKAGDTAVYSISTSDLAAGLYVQAVP